MAIARTPEDAVQNHLRSMNRRWRSNLLRRGLARSAGLGIVVLLMACALDAWLQPPLAWRWLITSIGYASIMWYTWQTWLRRWLTPFSARRVAWLVESACPELNEKLISSVELQSADDQQVSQAMIVRVLAQTEIDFSRIQPEDAFPFSWRQFRLPMLLVLILVIGLCIPPLHLSTLIGRVALPSARDASIGAYSLRIVTPGNAKYVEGDSIHFTVSASTTKAKLIELVVVGRTTSRITLTQNPKNGLYEGTLESARDSFLYWAEADAGVIRSQGHDVHVTARPKIESYEITYTFPDYTGMPSSVMESSTGDLRALIGTQITVKANCSKPIAHMSADFGARKVSATIAEDGLTGTFTFTVTENSDYSIDMADEAGNSPLQPPTFSLEAWPDRTPTVDLETPAADLNVNPGDTLDFVWQSRDDFGVDTHRVTVQINREEEFDQGELPGDISTWTLDLGPMNLQSGDLVSVSIAAHDGAGNVGHSPIRHIQVGAGRRLRDADAYLATTQRIDNQLSALLDNLDALIELTDTIGSMSHDISGDHHHFRNLLSRRTERTHRALAEACADAEALAALGFYNHADRYANLLARYLTQERLNAYAAQDSIIQLQQLSAAATLCREFVALQADKAHQHVAQFTVPLHIRTVERLQATPEDVDTERWATVLAKGLQHSRDIRSSLASELAEVAIPDKDGLRPGIRGHYFAGRNSYPAATEQGFTFARTDRQLDFADTLKFDLGDAPYAVIWTTVVTVQKAGQYRFSTTSDDGSRLLVGDTLVVNNDGDHNPQERHGEIELAVGQHNVTVLYINSGGAGVMQAHIRAPGQDRQILGVPYTRSRSVRGLEDVVPLLTELAKEATHLAADYSEADKVAEEIRKRLHNRNALHALAEELKVYDKKEDWQAIEDLAEAYILDAANEEDRIDRRDDALVAKVLEEAAEKQQSKAVLVVAEALPKLHELHEQRQAYAAIEDAILFAARELPEIRSQSATSETLPAARERVAALAADLEALQSRSLNDQALPAHADLKPLANQLAKAASESQAAERALAGQQSDQANQHLDRLDQALTEAQEQLKDAQARAENRREQIRNALSRHHDTTAEAIAEQAAQLSRDAAGHHDKAQELSAVNSALTETAHALRDAAAEAIESEHGDLEEATRQIALAGMLEQTRDHALRDAQMSANTQKNQAQEAIREATKALEEAAAAAEQHDAISAGKLAHDDAVTAHREVLEVAAELGKAEELQALEALARLRQARDRVQSMASTSRKLERQPNEAETTALAASTEAVKAEVTAELGQQRLEAQARNQLQRARNATDDLLQQTRKLRDAAAAGQAPDPLAEQERRLQSQAASLQEELEQAQSHQQLLAAPEPRLGDAFTDEIHKPLQAGAGKAVARQPADKELAQAIDGLKALRRDLDDMADQLQHQAASTAPEINNPIDTAAAIAEVDALEHAVSQAASSQHRAEQLQQPHDKHVNKAKQMLDEAAALTELTPKKRDALVQRRQQLTERKPSQQAEDLRAAANQIKDSAPKFAQALNEHAAVLQQDQQAANQVAQLEAKAKKHNQQAAKKREQLHARLNPVDTAAARSAEDLLEAIDAHSRVGEYEDALASVDALRETMANLENNEPLSPPVPETAAATEPTTAPTRPMSIAPEELGWNAHKGVLQQQAYGEEQKDGLPSTLAAALEEKDFASAAQAANNRARAQFEEAAKVEAARQDAAAADVAGKFRAPRQPLSTAAEQTLAKQAQEQPRDFVKATAQHVDEAAKLAAELASAVAETPDQAPALAADLQAKLRDVEAHRSAYGASDFPAAQAMHELMPALAATPADPSAAQEAAERAVAALDDYQQEVSAEERALKAHEELAKQLDKVSATSEDVAAKRAAIPNPQGESIRNLATQAADDERVPAALQQQADAVAKSPTTTLPSAQAKAAEQLAQALRAHAPDTSKALAEKAKATLQNTGIQNAETELAKAQASAATEIDTFAKSLANRQSLPLLEAQKALESARDTLRSGQGETGQQSLQEAAQHLAEAQPGPAPTSALNEEGYNAAAAANALQNQDAVNKALGGDLQGAAESMREFAEDLPGGTGRELALAAAHGFEGSQQADNERLPAALQQALAQAEKQAAELPTAPRAQLRKAACAARNEMFGEASKLIDQAIQETAKSQPTLAAVGEALKNAAKQRQERLNALNDSTQDALKQIAQLREQVANPLAASELAAATDEAVAGHLEDAMSHLEVAKGGLDGRHRAAVESIQEQLAAEAASSAKNRAARDALAMMQKPHSDVVDAAKAGDLKEAAARAQKHGEKAAATALEKAAAAELATLPPAGVAAVDTLEQAFAAAKGERRSQLREAQAAARKGDFANAQRLAEAAANGHNAELAVADAAEQAATYHANTVVPLAEAIAEAKNRRLSQAAAKAEKSSKGEEAAQQLAAAEAAVKKAISQALADAATIDDDHAHRKLTQAAEAAIGDNLNAALQHATQAGEHGKATRDAVEKAQHAANAAEKAIQQALEAAQENNEALERGSTAAEAQHALLTEQAGAEAAEHKRQTRVAAQLQSLQRSLQEQRAKPSQLDDLQRAAIPESLVKALDRMAKSNGDAKTAAQQQAATAADLASKHASHLANGLQNPLSKLGEALRRQQSHKAPLAALHEAATPNTVAQPLTDMFAQAGRGADAAETAAQKDNMPAETAKQLRHAADSARQGKLQDAVKHAQAAGDAGRAAAAAFEKAEAARQRAVDALPTALDSARTQAKLAQQQQQALQKRAALQQQFGNRLQSIGQAESVMNDAIRAAEGAHQAREAARQLAQAQVEAQAAANRPSLAGKRPFDANDDAHLAAAVAALQNAEAAMASGRATPASTSSLAQAARELAAAESRTAEAAASEVDAAAATGGQANHGRSQGGNGSGGGSANGMNQPSSPQPPEIAGNLGPTWTGVEQTLRGSDRSGQRNQYNDYYREANRRYLERLAQESTKWQ